MCCEDCGTKMNNSVCMQCAEELFIYETQADYAPEFYSEDFIDKVVEQEAVRSKLVNRLGWYNDEVLYSRD